MHFDNLHELINRYEEKQDIILSKPQDELFKFRGIQWFQNTWFSQDKSIDFARRFKYAIKETDNFIDSSSMRPAEGIYKIAQLCKNNEVETLFSETLFSGEKDLKIVQEQVDVFLFKIESLRKKFFPAFYKYKQDMHSALGYLSCFNPEFHFPYRFTNIKLFAEYIEYGKEIGSGSDFNLANYYDMMEIVIEALREHPSLLEYRSRAMDNDSSCYKDANLHITAYDLTYCCWWNKLYVGLIHASKEEIRQKAKDDASMKKTLQRIAELEDAIAEKDILLGAYDDISLLDVQVQTPAFGKGQIIKHDHNVVTVQFDGFAKNFMLGTKFICPLKYEDSDSINRMFDEYAILSSERKGLQSELSKLEKNLNQ